MTFAAPGTYTYYCLIHTFMKGSDHRPVTRPQAALTALLATGAAALAAAPAAGAATREFWVAATPVVWNMAPNQRDNITGARLDPGADRDADDRLPPLLAELAPTARQLADVRQPEPHPGTADARPGR